MLPPLQCIIKRAQLSNTNQYLTPGSCMTDYLGKKRACWLSSEPAWQDSMDISIESTWQTRTSVRVGKRERPWSTSYFDVKNGRRTGQNYYNVPTPTEEIYLSS